MSIRDYTEAVGSPSTTPQTQPIPGKQQVLNSAGGYVFALDVWKRLDRFLILGSDSNTYYVSQKELTKDNVKSVTSAILEDGPRVVARIVEVSTQALAPKNDPAIFALALCMAAGNDNTKRLAREAVPKVCRIGTHLFALAEALKALEIGWGRSTRKAFADWYTKKNAADLAYDLIKYQSRNGWAHSDIIRLAHPLPPPTHSDLIRWSLGHFFDKKVAAEYKGRHTFKYDSSKAEAAQKAFLLNLPKDKAMGLVWAFETAKKATKESEIVRLVNEYGLPRECIPTQFLNSMDVWSALLDNQGRGMPMMALVRNVNKMSAVGILNKGSEDALMVVSKLTDKEALTNSMIHPMTCYIAYKTYSSGHGVKGDLIWNPNPDIVEALEFAFYNTFKNAKSTGKKRLVALDVSGSMTSPIHGTNISSMEASAAMSLVTKNVDPNTKFMAFSNYFMELKTDKATTLESFTKAISGLSFQSTDCSLPMQYALEKGLDFDSFEVYTDNETYAGRMHPTEALKKYRNAINSKAKLVVAGLNSTEFTIADPNDPGCLDVVGFDASIQKIISDFISD